MGSVVLDILFPLSTGVCPAGLLSSHPLRESRWCNGWLSGCPHSVGYCECVASILASSADLGAIVAGSLGGDACCGHRGRLPMGGYEGCTRLVPTSMRCSRRAALVVHAKRGRCCHREGARSPWESSWLYWGTLDPGGLLRGSLRLLRCAHAMPSMFRILVP